MCYIGQIIFVEAQIAKVKQMQPKNEEDRKRDEKYSCFVQEDLKISLPQRLFCWTFMSLFILIRIFCMIFVLFWSCVWLYFCAMIYPKNSKELRAACHKGTVWTGTLLAATASVFTINYKRRKDICYKKYLGPDWTPSFENFSTVVTNHSCWIDTLVLMSRYPTSFIAKASVEHLPFVGMIASSCGSLYIQRGSKDARASMFEQIAKRQEEAERGDATPLIMHPEGGTTNGRAMIKFKKGAFAALRAVKPHAIKYWSSFMPIESGAIPFESHLWLMGLNMRSSCEIDEFPTFKPNQYFWDNHLKEGEDKAVCYARCIRELMSKESNMVLAEIDIEEKYDYRALIWPKYKKGE